MSVASVVDTALDRTVVLGYGNVGLRARRRLPTWPADPPRMDGKVVLVTGAASGIGLAAAAGFAGLGASVRVLARDRLRAEQAVRLTRERAGPGAPAAVPVACDLTSRAELRSFVEAFLSGEPRLDVLVNNAGVMPDERSFGADGVELDFATHVLAPWMLIRGLAPLLARSAPARVINVTSGGQYDQRIPTGDLQSLHGRYGPKKVYARTKREEMVITEQWARRLAGQGIHVHAMHPGWADTKGVRQWMPLFRAVTRPIIRTPEEGADTVVWLGAAPEALHSTGLLWHDRRPRPTTYALGAGPDSDAARQELWDHLTDLASAPDRDRPAP
ncbi:SDR family NAD(P)-dependent oxidoreductase [Kitasatospora sp. NPDC085895]|uniref:SDR family NAD(P)-dependent oxidoreductase n=1 Tax=Kitasatospora sp. NPDC085895 TaxID=3155057 RepID=UPI00344F3719